MDEETQDEKPSMSILASRYRSPIFSKIEVQTLINIIDEHKYTVLNKSTNTAVNQAKELSWDRITKDFNSRGFKHERSIDSLKNKWDNLKRDVRRHSKNLLDIDNSSNDDVTRQIVTMMCDVENNPGSEINQSLENTDDFNESTQDDEKITHNVKGKSYWEMEQKNSEESNDGNEDDQRANRSLNFSPQECSLLLQCVRNEKNHVFSREHNAHAIGLKNRAWRRITDAFNRSSPQKRTQKVLRTKFGNMKTVAKNMGIKDTVKKFNLNGTKHEKLVNESSKKIKSEPVFEMEVSGGEDAADSDHFAPDPLGNVLNSDSGIGSTHSSSWSQYNKEVAKLKLELLNYKMETARLERQRLEESSRAELSARESDATAASLRLRAARLAAVAAAARLPPAHPALHYPPDEQRAERYLRLYEHT